MPVVECSQLQRLLPRHTVNACGNSNLAVAPTLLLVIPAKAGIQGLSTLFLSPS
jgi:hypothetical protein